MEENNKNQVLQTKTQIFDNSKIRSVWDRDNEKWYFAIVDVVAVLTESADPFAYWRKLKQRLKEEGNESVTNCHGLKICLQKFPRQKSPKMKIRKILNKVQKWQFQVLKSRVMRENLWKNAVQKLSAAKMQRKLRINRICWKKRKIENL